MTKFQGLRRFKGLTEKETEAYLDNNNYFATLMLATAQADAMLSGATVTASSALRPLLQIIQRQEKANSVSSLNIFDLQEPETGKDRVLFLGDCAVIPNPDSAQISDIAVNTAALAYHLTNEKPRVALLSYTSKSVSSKNEGVIKMKAATELARQKAKELDIPMEIDGELQVDAALDPFVAQAKQLQGSVPKGQRPHLPRPPCRQYRLQDGRCAHPRPTYGPILTGLTRPAAEISRGATANDIFGTAVMIASQAIDHRLLYPTEGDTLNEDVTVL